MITVPQEASVMAGRPFKNIIPALQRAVTAKQTKVLGESNGLVHALTDGTDVPAFTLPIHIRDAMGQEYICLDLRKQKREYKLSEDGDKFFPLLLTDTAFMSNLALAQYIWLKRPSEFNIIFNDAGRIFATWVGFEISKRLVLSPLQQNEMVIYFAYYWFTRYMDEGKIRNEDYQFICLTIQRLFGYDINLIQQTLDPLQYEASPTLNHFCTLIRETNPNPKLKDLSSILVISMLFNGWIASSNARELIAVALEYPPLFMLMMYRGLSERSFKNAKISELALRLLTGQKQQTYILAFDNLLQLARNGL